MTDKPNMKWAFIETLGETVICPVCGKEYPKPIRPGWGYKSKDVWSKWQEIPADHLWVRW